MRDGLSCVGQSCFSVHLLFNFCDVMNGFVLCCTGIAIKSVSLFISNMLILDGSKLYAVCICVALYRQWHWICVVVCQQHVDIGWVKVLSSVHLIFLNITRVVTVDMRSKRGHFVVFHSKLERKNVVFETFLAASCLLPDFKGFWARLGDLLETSWSLLVGLGESWKGVGSLLEASWARLGTSWGHLGGPLGVLVDFLLNFTCFWIHFRECFGSQKQ